MINKKILAGVFIIVILFLGINLISNNAYRKLDNKDAIHEGYYHCLGTGRNEVRLEYRIEIEDNTFKVYQDKTEIHKGKIEEIEDYIVFVEDKTNKKMNLYEDKMGFYIEISYYSGKLFDDIDEIQYLHCN